MRKFFIFVLILSLFCSFCVFSSLASSDTSIRYTFSSWSSNSFSLTRTVLNIPITQSYFISSDYITPPAGTYSVFLSDGPYTSYGIWYREGDDTTGSLVVTNSNAITCSGNTHIGVGSLGYQVAALFGTSSSSSNSDSITLMLVPVSSSGGSSSGGSFPSSSQTQYTAGSPQSLISTLSRQSFNYGIDRSGDFVVPVLAETDYFQYPNVASGILGPMTVGSTSSAPLLGSQEPCYIRQYFDVRLSEGYYSFQWSLPSPPSISYNGDVIAYAAGFPGVQAGTVSGSFYSGGVGAVVPPSGISQVDGYYYVSHTGIYTFYCDFNYTSSWPAYVLSGDLTAVAPNPPQLIATPFTKSIVETPGSEILLPSAPSDTSDTSSKANTDAILSYLGSLYVQYMKDSVSDFTSYLPQYGLNGYIYASPLGTLPNQSVGSILSLMNSQNMEWWSTELSFLDAISQAIPQLSQIRTQLDGSLSPVVSLLQSVQSGLYNGNISYLDGIYDHLSDFMVNWARIALEERDYWEAQEAANAQAHSDIWTLISAVRNLQLGDGAVRPWEQFEDDYITNEKSSIESTKDVIDNSNALGTLTDISGGVSSGDYGDSSLEKAEDAVTSGDMYSLWSQTTNDAFNGDVDDWYSDDAIGGRQSW